MTLRRRTSSRVVRQQPQTPEFSQSDLQNLKSFFLKSTLKKNARNECIAMEISSRIDTPDFELVRNIARHYRYILRFYTEKYDIETKTVSYRLNFSMCIN